jgi:TolA-binding protein
MTGREERGRLTSRAAVAVASLLILADRSSTAQPSRLAAPTSVGASETTLATIPLTGASTIGALHQQSGGGEEFARRQYETGLAFMRDGRYQEALKDFQAVADNHPSSAVADQALLQIATYHFEQARDVAKASAALEQLLKAYPTGRAAPFAYLLSGRIALVSASAPGSAPSKERVDAALASFERARRLFPVPEVTAAAGYYTGEALRASGRCADAMKAYQDVIVDYPRLVWSSRAELGVGRCLVTLDRAREAMPHLQRVRRAATGMPAGEAETALRWNTILARLLLRAPADPAFTFASRAGGAGGAMTTQVRDVVAMAIAPKGDVAVLSESAFVVHAAQGGVVESFTVNQPRGLALDAEGRPVIVTERGLMRERAQLVTLRTGSASGGASSAAGGGGVAAAATGRPLEELAAVGILANGDIIAADRRTRAIHRFDAEGQPRGVFAAVNASRLAVNERDDVAAMEREGKSIVLLDASGTIVRRIPPRGDGYTMADPADVAIDAIGHIYVLDRDQAAVFVFAKDGRLLATLRSPEAGESAFRQPSSIALDPAGRLYIHDERQRTVVIYQ